MHTAYVLSVFLHILAACTWIGGMAFLVLVVVPYLRTGDRAQGAVLVRETGIRFRTVGWVCLGLLALSGLFNLHCRGIPLAQFAGSAFWFESPFGQTLALKVGVFAVILLMSSVHDFYVGPAATRALEHAPRSDEAARLRRWASWMGRTNALLALLMVLLGVMLVRGALW